VAGAGAAGAGAAPNAAVPNLTAPTAGAGAVDPNSPPVAGAGVAPKPVVAVEPKSPPVAGAGAAAAGAPKPNPVETKRIKSGRRAAVTKYVRWKIRATSDHTLGIARVPLWSTRQQVHISNVLRK